MALVYRTHFKITYSKKAGFTTRLSLSYVTVPPALTDGDQHHVPN